MPESGLAVGLAYDPYEAVLYAIAGSDLLSMDPLLGDPRYVGTLPGDPYVSSLAFDAASGMLHGLNAVTGELLLIDPQDASYTIVGSTGLTWSYGLASGPGPGELLAVEDLTHQLFVIDGESAATTAVGPFSGSVQDTGSVYVLDLPTGEVYCTAGTSASGCTASLSATGLASATAASGFSLQAGYLEGGKDGLFFFGANGRQANPWGNGTSYQCVVPPVTRAGLLVGAGISGVCDGAFEQDLNALWCPSCPKPSRNPGAGATVQAQLWYRDPLSTSNQTTSLSDALEFTLAP